jgi:hypothetical protein
MGLLLLGDSKWFVLRALAYSGQCYFGLLLCSPYLFLADCPYTGIPDACSFCSKSQLNHARTLHVAPQYRINIFASRLVDNAPSIYVRTYLEYVDEYCTHSQLLCAKAIK